MRLAGKVALVTGAGQGIGQAIARAFAEQGASVVVSDISENALAGSLEQLSQAEASLGIACDVSDSRAVKAMFAQVRERFGRLDILVNNAGIGQAPGDGFNQYQARLDERMAQLERGETPTVFADHVIDMNDAGWQKVLDVSLNGAFYCAREAVQLMIDSEVKGSIISVSSTSALTGEGGVHYCAAKAGILGLTRGLAEELGARGIRVNAVCPGPTLTPAMMGISEEWRQSMAQRVPLQRLAEPKEIARAVLFLASDDGSFVTGQNLVANGGMHML